jgi:hypothetical protein
MAKKHPHDPEGSDRDREFEHDKGNAAHIEIEERRFRGGLPPTPELYALAREQWNKLPGSVVKPSMNQDKPAEGGDEDKKEGSK